MSMISMFAMHATNVVAKVQLDEGDNKTFCRITGKINGRQIQVETFKKETYWITLNKIIQLYPDRKPPEYMIGYQVLVKPDSYNQPYWIIIAEITDITDCYSHYTYKFKDLHSNTVYDQALAEHEYVEIISVFKKPHTDDEDITRLMKQLTA